MTLPNWTKEELIEIGAKASGFYGTLQGITSTPREAAEIILMMHMLLWMNHGDGETTCDAMLEDYCKNFKRNYEIQMEWQKGKMN